MCVGRDTRECLLIALALAYTCLYPQTVGKFTPSQREFILVFTWICDGRAAPTRIVRQLRVYTSLFLAVLVLRWLAEANIYNYL